MRFQNVKAEELEGPIKLSGFSEWKHSVQNGASATSLLLASSPGLGKGSAVGSLAHALHYDIIRARLSQLLDYPDSETEFRAMLQGTENLHRTVVWLDGLDKFLAKLPGGPQGGQAILEDWLKSAHDSLTRNQVVVVATAHQASAMAKPLVEAFDQRFVA
jgi:hypothetical protein